MYKGYRDKEKRRQYLREYMRKYRTRPEVKKKLLRQYQFEKVTDLYGLFVALVGYLKEAKGITKEDLWAYMEELTDIPKGLGEYHATERLQRALSVTEKIANKVLTWPDSTEFHKQEAMDALESVLFIKKQLRQKMKFRQQRSV